MNLLFDIHLILRIADYVWYLKQIENDTTHGVWTYEARDLIDVEHSCCLNGSAKLSDARDMMISYYEVMSVFVDIFPDIEELIIKSDSFYWMTVCYHSRFGNLLRGFPGYVQFDLKSKPIDERKFRLSYLFDDLSISNARRYQCERNLTGEKIDKFTPQAMKREYHRVFPNNDNLDRYAKIDEALRKRQKLSESNFLEKHLTYYILYDSDYDLPTMEYFGETEESNTQKEMLLSILNTIGQL